MNTDLKSEDLVWKKEYNIGNYKIDSEHQQLFAIARKSLKINSFKNDKESISAIKEVFKELYLYVNKHFENEELYMKDVDYPDLEPHKILHKEILDHLNQVIKDVTTLEKDQIIEQIISFIKIYLLDHITEEDKKIQLWVLTLDDIRTSHGWKEIYKVGDEKIDDEHKNLFEIAEQAFKVVDNEHRIEKIHEVVKNLYAYLKEHFKNEENYMKEVTYPLIEEHKQLHKNIISEMNIFIKDIKTMNIELFEKRLAQMIEIHLVQHIIKEDKKLVLHARGIEINNS